MEWERRSQVVSAQNEAIEARAQAHLTLQRRAIVPDEPKSRDPSRALANLVTYTAEHRNRDAFFTSVVRHAVTRCVLPDRVRHRSLTPGLPLVPPQPTP